MRTSVKFATIALTGLLLAARSYGAGEFNQYSTASGSLGVGGLTITGAGAGFVTISWPAINATNGVSSLATLVSSPSITPSPVTWTPVGIAPTLANNRYSVTVSAAGAPKYYKRLGHQ